MLGMFLINIVSAFDFDNKLSYSVDNKQVNIKNLFGLGVDYADIKITSHENLSKPIYVNSGDHVLIQNIGGKENYNDFIGKAVFKNMKTGEIEEIDYYWEKAIYGEVLNMEEVCIEKVVETNGTIYEECFMKENGKKQEIVSWERFDIHNIKKGEKITIGIVVPYIKPMSVYDVIPKFFGKEIKEWATYTNIVVDDHGKVFTSADAVTVKVGMQIETNQDTYIINVTKDPNYNTATRCYIYNTSDSNTPETQLINASFIGHTATFNFSVEDATKYFIMFDKEGASYVPSVKSQDSYPTAGTNVDWISSYLIGTGHQSTLYRGIRNIVTGDLLAIDLNITYPLPTTYNINTFDLKSTQTIGDGKTCDSIWYSLDLGQTNSSRADCGTNWSSLTASEGSNTWTVYGNLTDGTLHNDTVTFSVDITPTISITYPTATFYNYYPSELNYSVTSGGTLDSCWYSLNLGQTNSSRADCGTNWSSLIASEGSNTWTVYGNITTGTMGNSTVTFTTDTINPNLTITYPNVIDYHHMGENLSLNWTVNDTNLDSCWYNWDGTNVSISCTNNQTYLNTTDGSNTNITFYANDSYGNLNSTFHSWSYKIFENSRTFTESLFETEAETYSINVTANSSLTGIKLVYNETPITMTNQGDGLWTYSRDVPEGTGNFSLYFNFTYATDYIISSNDSQEVNLTYFEQTNVVGNIFLNISFKDENSLTYINASIPYSLFTYYLGSGSVNKTLEFINNTNNLEYNFNGTTGSKNLYVIPNVQYRRVDDYPQRIWTPTLRTYNSIQTDQILYSLSSTDGIYVTYQVVTAAETTIEGVEVTATRVVSGETIQVGAGTTDAAGTVTFWMNPDFQHTVTFTKTGYDDYVFIHFPTQASYTITLGGETGTKQSCVDGITQTIKPSQDFLWSNETYNFNYTIYSSYWNLTEMKFTLTGDGVALGSDTSTSSSGGIITLNDINTSSYSIIQMDYYYDLNETDDECGQITGIRVWIIQSSEGTEFGIWRLTEDLNTYISASLFGFDDFGKTLLSFVIIVLMVGGLSKRYGIASESAIMGILFGTVFMLDVGLGFIPKVQIRDIVSVNHFFTYITFIILFVIVIREERH